MNTEITRTAYQLLHTAAIVQRPEFGVLRLAGDDRVDFLQRMTTNDIAALKPGQSAVTVLTSPTARILFVFTVLCREDNLLLLTAGPNQTDALAKYLRGQIFFMDKVSVHPEPNHTRLRVVGSQAPELLGRLVEGAADLTDQTFVAHNETLILRQSCLSQSCLDLPGFELIANMQSVEKLMEELDAAGFSRVEEPAAYDARRIEQGVPVVGHELVDDYTPLETGLAWTCAENKGCYTGQEIIARQITYDKVTRHLAGLVLDGPVEPGATVLVEDKAAGTVTSSGFNPVQARHIALAIIRRAYNSAGQPVVIRTGTDGETQGRIVELPMQTDAVLTQHLAE